VNFSIALTPAILLLFAPPARSPQHLDDPVATELGPTLHHADTARRRWWSIDLGVGPALAITDYGWSGRLGMRDPLTADALGPAFRVAAHVQRQRGTFYVGGGPVLTYSAWHLREGSGTHWGALGGELLIGGGRRRFLVYGHLQAAIGLSSIALGTPRSAGGSEYSVGFLPRLAGGLGARGYLGQRGRLSVGGLIDYVVISGLEVYLTIGVHFR
jgi:hypothetical protein